MKARHVPSHIYTKEYYLHTCFGFKEFARSWGKEIPEKIKQFCAPLTISPGIKILDLGCGRGDMAFYLARLGGMVTGIDYAKDAIALAKIAQKKQPTTIQKRVKFVQMDARKLHFKDNTFDIVTSVDVFEHLYPEELDQVLIEIKRVLKPNGMLLVHTEPNVIYLNFTHNFYCYPVSTLLIFVNALITGKKYPNLPKNPRNEYHRQQHVNEPTIFYLRKLFATHKFLGSINQKVSGLKPIYSWKDRVYNLIVWLYPFCNTPLGKLFFAYDYVCLMKNVK